MTDDRPAPHRQPDEADQPRDPRTPDESAAAAFDDGPADRAPAGSDADTSAFERSAFATPSDDERDAREAQAREADQREQEAREADQRERESREQEAREAEARERESREQEAREAEAREQEARDREAREAEARRRDVEDRERREREAREADARERDDRDRQARDEEAARQSASQPIYVQAPVPPEKRGNRGFGVLIAVVAGIVFALLYSLGTALLASVRNPNAFGDVFGVYLLSPVFTVPTIAFLVFFVLLALLVNRGRWWAFVLGGLPVAILVYAAYVVARFLQADGLNLEAAEQALVLQRTVTLPDGILAGFLARELVTWLGAGISARGRRVKAKNVEARAEYDRKLREQPDHR